MANPLMPTYRYRPSVGGTSPTIRSRSIRRARLFAGGTYFRARDPGSKGNNISIEVLQFYSEIPGEEEVLKGKLIVTNHNTVPAENVTGPVTVELLEQNLNWNERFVIDQLTTSPRLLRYAIDLRTVVQQSLQEDLGPFAFLRLFHLPSKLSVKLSLNASEVTQNDVVTLKSRTRVYDLVPFVPVPEPGGGGELPVTGWDIAALRTAVAEDPWIEMLPRSGTPLGVGGTPGIPLVTKFDEQDDGVDAAVLTPFTDTYLTGGDGLPEFPTGERTGPTRSVIYVRYSERYNGAMADVNELYEWVGESFSSGEWRRY